MWNWIATEGWSLLKSTLPGLGALTFLVLTVVILGGFLFGVILVSWAVFDRFYNPVAQWFLLRSRLKQLLVEGRKEENKDRWGFFLDHVRFKYQFVEEVCRNWTPVRSNDLAQLHAKEKRLKALEQELDRSKNDLHKAVLVLLGELEDYRSIYNDGDNTQAAVGYANTVLEESRNSGLNEETAGDTPDTLPPEDSEPALQDSTDEDERAT